MAVFDIKNLNEGAWFPFDDGKVKIRGYTNDIIASLRDRYIKKIVEYKKKAKFGELQRIEYTDYIDDGEDEMKAELYDYVIEDWQNFVDPSGKKITCNKKNKQALMNGSPAFANFVDECLEKVGTDEEDIKEASEKN